MPLKSLFDHKFVSDPVPDDALSVAQKNLEVIRVQEPAADPFAPKDDSENGQADQGEGEKGDTDFPFGANADGGAKS